MSHQSITSDGTEEPKTDKDPLQDLPKKFYSLSIGSKKISEPAVAKEDFYIPDGFAIPEEKRTRRVTIHEGPATQMPSSPNLLTEDYTCKTNPFYRGGRRSRYSTFISGIDQFDPYQELTGMQIAAFRQVFDMVDKDGGGSIDAEELYNSMKDLESNLNLDEIKEILEELDRDGNGEIDFEEFLYMMTSMSLQIKEAQNETDETQKNADSKRRQSIFFSVITKFAMKHSLKEIEHYYASKTPHAPHVVGHYAAGARVVGLTDRELRRTWKDLSAASKGMDSPYAQPLNFFMLSDHNKGDQKKTIRLKRKKNEKKARVTPSPNFFDNNSSKSNIQSFSKCSKDQTSMKTTKIGWTPRHRLPITKVRFPKVNYDKKKLNVSEMNKIRERVTQAKNSYYTKLSIENERKAKEYWGTLKVDEIESHRLQTNFKRVFRAYSPTNEYETHVNVLGEKQNKQIKIKQCKKLQNRMEQTMVMTY